MKYKISHKVKPNIKVSFNKNQTNVTINGKTYSARCHPEDRFDKEKGVLLCLAQAQGISYKKLTQLMPKASKPIVLTNELKMKNRTSFVKIIHPSIARNKEDYGKNSVLPIYKTCNDRIIRYGKNPGQFLVPQEFVKLNNYKYPISNLYKLLKIVKSLTISVRDPKSFDIFHKYILNQGELGSAFIKNYQNIYSYIENHSYTGIVIEYKKGKVFISCIDMLSFQPIQPTIHISSFDLSK